MTFKETYPAARFDADGKHIGPGPWLKVIHEANRLAAAEGLDALFDGPTYENENYAVEIYRDATVTHDFPTPDLPPLPPDPWSREWDMISHERERIRDANLRDPRKTVTITSKTPLGERLLTAAHATLCAHCYAPDPTGFACCQDCADRLAAEGETAR